MKEIIMSKMKLIKTYMLFMSSSFSLYSSSSIIVIFQFEYLLMMSSINS